MSKKECYPEDWRHCTIHLNPKTGEMHSDGDHRVRHWIQERLTAEGNNQERVAQLIAHRACGSEEHDPANGKIHGCCVVCLTPWPCTVAVQITEQNND